MGNGMHGMDVKKEGGVGRQQEQMLCPPERPKPPRQIHRGVLGVISIPAPHLPACTALPRAH